jgi:hypothetical protein
MFIGKLESTLNEANSMSSCYRVPSEEARAEITSNKKSIKEKAIPDPYHRYQSLSIFYQNCITGLNTELNVFKFRNNLSIRL